MTAAPAEQSGFGFEDTVPTSSATGDWNGIQSVLRPGAGPADLREAKHRGDLLAAAANALTVQYLELLSAHERQSLELKLANDELDRVRNYLAELDEDGADTYEIAKLIRWEHDRTHAIQGKAWAVCPHEVCRAAGQYAR